MADDLNLTQYLLENPLYNYGGQLRQQGSQMGPVLSWQEGLARALQGTAGGAFQGLANYQALGERRADQQAIQQATLAAGKGDWDAARRALASRPNTANQAWQLSMQDAQLQRQLDLMKAQQQMQQQTGASILGSLGMGGGQSPSLPAGGSPGAQPAGFENNWGNIRDQTGKGFGGYQTPQAGVDAMYGNLQIYAQQNPNITVAQALSKWAPPSENNTQGYISNVAEGSGINPGMPLADVLKDQGQRASLLDAIGRFGEHKPQPQGMTADTFMGAKPGPVFAPQQGASAQASQIPPGFTMYSGQPVHAGTFQMGVASVRAGKIDEGTKLIQKSLEMGASLATDPKLVEVPDPKNPGQTVRVPSWQAAGQQAGHYAAPGSKEGDIAILQGGNPGTPEYRAAYDRLNMPTLGQGGQYIAPPVGSYRPPTYGGAPPATPQVQMSPEGKMKAESDLATEFNKNDAVQKVKTMEPWLTSIDKAMDVPGGYGDMAILQSYYRLMNPGSERPQGPQAAEAYASMGNFPEELKKKIHGVVEGKQFLTPAERSQMREQAYTQFNAFKGAYDRASENVRQRAAAAGLNADAVIGAPLTAESSASPLSAPGGGAQKPQYRMLPSGKLEKVQ